MRIPVTCGYRGAWKMSYLVATLISTGWAETGKSRREETVTMAQVHDVAVYILSKVGPTTAMKLQKLCYYSQAWHLVWEEVPLFDSEIQAWANGPVIVDLYRTHRGRLQVAATDIPGNADGLTLAERESIDVVLNFYGDMSAHELSELTHHEAPWASARRHAGLQPMERGNAVITHDSMFEYYDGLTAADG
jgi:uncharacterized phage-associated protein